MTATTTSLAEAAKRLLPDMVELRRSIHREPEVGLALPRTQRKIVDRLADLGLVVELGRSTTSVVADLEGTGNGPTVLLRADMDALPIPEETGLDHASRFDSVMHACGHDAHVAMLVGTARLLAERRDEVAGRVRFAFQPGEESHGGARHLIEEGVLEGVDAVFALHVTPNLPSGWLGTRAGTIMASADSFHISFRGRGGHPSTPHLARDPIPAACAFVQSLQGYIGRERDPFEPVVVAVARIVAGTAHNAVPESALVEGTYRTTQHQGRAAIAEAIRRIANGVAAMHECESEVDIRAGYPVTINDRASADALRRVSAEVIGSRKIVALEKPVMGAEDFSYYLRKVPGALAMLGVCPSGVSPARAASCHSSRMVIDESALWVGAGVHAAIALDFLSAGRPG